MQNLLKCYYMQERIGENFVGSISAVTAFGIFVALDEVYVEGLVHVSELGADYFQFDPIKHQMLGERTGQRFRLGDRVRVKLVKADLESNRIDFVLVNDRDRTSGARRQENPPPFTPSARDARGGKAPARGARKAR